MAADQAGLPVLAFAGAANGKAGSPASQPASAKGLWLKFARKASGVPTTSKPEAIDLALL